MFERKWETTGRKMIMPSVYRRGIRELGIGLCCPHIFEPPSGASIGIPANSFQLACSGSFTY
jgi:hypothetical protein